MLGRENKITYTITVIYLWGTVIGSILLFVFWRQHFWSLMAWVIFFVVAYLFSKLHGAEEFVNFRRFLEANPSQPIQMCCGWKWPNLGFFNGGTLFLKNGEKFHFRTESGCKKAIKMARKINPDFQIQHSSTFFRNRNPVPPDKTLINSRFWRSTL